MLFGRKTPPAAPKADSPVPPQPGVRPYTLGEPGAVSSPLASLNAPAQPPGPGTPAAASAPTSAVAAGAAAPSMAHALADTQHAAPAYPDMPSASKGPDMNSIPKPPSALCRSNPIRSN